MPQAIALAIIGWTGSALAISAVAAVVSIGLTIGVSALMSSLFGPDRPRPSDGQQVNRSSVGTRKRHYGIVHSGGQLTFFESAGGTLAQVVTLGTGHETEIIEHRINNKVVTVAGGAVTDASYHGAVHIYTRDGDDNQTAIAELTAAFPQWTVNHRQRGCAHAAILAGPVDQDKFNEVYNGQAPQYTQVRKAARVYDPRKDSTAGGSGAHRLNDPSTWEWSDNAALVTADYAAHPDGYNLGYGNINWANIAAEADICDQTVTTVTEETIKRWRIWASYKLADDERKAVLKDLLAACDGFCWQDAEGKFCLKVGRFEMPTVIITDDHILGMTASMGPEAQKRVSAIKVLYTEAAIGYREQESATVGLAGAAEDPNTDPQAVPVYFAPHHNQAARIGKLLFSRLGDERWHIAPRLNLYGLNLFGERFCRLQSVQLGVDAYFSIEKLKLDLGNQAVEVTLSQVDPEDWNFDAATEEGTPPLVGDDTTTAVTIEVPTDVTVSPVQIVLGETSGVAIAASWGMPSRAGLVYQARYRPTTGGDWVIMTVDDAARTARSGPVNSGVEYEVQVRALTISYWASDWSASVTITPSAEQILSAPTAFSVTGASGSANATFRMPTESSLGWARLYRGTSSSFGSAVQVGSDIVGGLGEVISITDSPLSSGAKYYWVRAFTTSGAASTLVGPVTATVT